MANLIDELEERNNQEDLADIAWEALEEVEDALGDDAKDGRYTLDEVIDRIEESNEKQKKP